MRNTFEHWLLLLLTADRNTSVSTASLSTSVHEVSGSCQGSPCASVPNSTGRCTPTPDEPGYKCGCTSGSFWDGPTASCAPAGEASTVPQCHNITSQGPSEFRIRSSFSHNHVTAGMKGQHEQTQAHRMQFAFESHNNTIGWLQAP